RYLGRASGGRSWAPDLDLIAVLAGLAMAARPRRKPLVPDGATVPTEKGGRLVVWDTRGCRGIGTDGPLKPPWHHARPPGKIMPHPALLLHKPEMRSFLLIAMLALTACAESTISKIDNRTYVIESA